MSSALVPNTLFRLLPREMKTEDWRCNVRGTSKCGQLNRFDKHGLEVY